MTGVRCHWLIKCVCIFRNSYQSESHQGHFGVQCFTQGHTVRCQDRTTKQFGFAAACVDINLAGASSSGKKLFTTLEMLKGASFPTWVFSLWFTWLAVGQTTYMAILSYMNWKHKISGRWVHIQKAARLLCINIPPSTLTVISHQENAPPLQAPSLPPLSSPLSATPISFLPTLNKQAGWAYNGPPMNTLAPFWHC